MHAQCVFSLPVPMFKCEIWLFFFLVFLIWCYVSYEIRVYHQVLSKGYPLTTSVVQFAECLFVFSLE